MCCTVQSKSFVCIQVNILGAILLMIMLLYSIFLDSVIKTCYMWVVLTGRSVPVCMCLHERVTMQHLFFFPHTFILFFSGCYVCLVTCHYATADIEASAQSCLALCPEHNVHHLCSKACESFN